jgi:hypothetical protein
MQKVSDEQYGTPAQGLEEAICKDPVTANFPDVT